MAATGLEPQRAPFDLSQVLERITDAVLAFDVSWNFTYMNSRAETVFGLDRRDAVGRNAWEVFPLTVGTLFDTEYRRAMLEQRAVEFVAYSPNVHTWFEVRAYPSADGLSVYFHDVSERIEAERRLEAGRAQHEAAAALGRLALRNVGLGRLRREAIDAAVSALGGDAGDILERQDGSPWLRLCAGTGWGDDVRERERVGSVSLAGYALGELSTVIAEDLARERRFRDASLERCRMASGISVPFGEPGAFNGTINIYSRQPRPYADNDISFLETIASILAEATALERTRERLRASGRQVTELLESIADAFVAVDREERIVYVNTALETWSGRTRDTLLGQPFSVLLEGENREVWQKYRAAVATRKPQTADYHSTSRERWYEVRAYPSGTGASLTFRDITVRKALDASLREMNASLEARVAERTGELAFANKELESFAYSVSHDLRAPLRAIDGFAQALAEDYGELFDEKAASYLERVRRASARMADLIDALLEFSRIARVPMERRPVSLSELAHQAVEDLRRAEPERAVDVRIADGMVVRGERHLLAALIGNLINNAWKFTRGRSPARIDIGPLEGESQTFFVRDNGAGFDMTFASKLFGAFSRLHAVHEFEGTGIGLATVARIVHRHGGAVRAEGAVGAGATFIFSLPNRNSPEHA